MAIKLKSNSQVSAGISSVERDTGISKDTLRIWERRYGFPQPQRDANGERVYPAGQIERLRLIKLLIDQRHRPGKIVGRPARELARMISKRAPRAEQGGEYRDFITTLKSHDVDGIQHYLSQRLMRQGLERFVIDTVATFNLQVGEAWARGELAVHEEHLYSQQLENALRHAIFMASHRGGPPRVLLTSMPGEQHRLGLLMAEALFTAAGACCVALGAQTPVNDIVLAAVAHRIDIVALSFSGSFQPGLAQQSLRDLRAALPSPIAIWAGGHGSQRAQSVAGIKVVRDFDQLQPALSAWHALRAAAS